MKRRFRETLKTALHPALLIVFLTGSGVSMAADSSRPDKAVIASNANATAVASQPKKEPRQKGSAAKKTAVDLRITPDPALPNVLLLGDSISIGYTLPVRQLLRGKANVFRPVRENGAAENCSDTGNGVENLDRWLALQRKWDVIHFNWGLHDLKHMVEGAPVPTPSSDPSSPILHTVEEYKANLKTIVTRLRVTGARLIFATTTPVAPETTRPFRAPEDPPRYNAAAVEIMKANGVRVNDLFAAVQPRLAEMQLPKNVHFTPAGSEFLAQQVAAAILAELEAKSPR